MDANAVLAVIVVVAVFAIVVFVIKGAPRKYTIVRTSETHGVSVEKCPNCGFILSQQVSLESGLGSYTRASRSTKMKINGHEVCPNCGVKLQGHKAR